VKIDLNEEFKRINDCGSDIPVWMLRLPIGTLSLGAKVCYGRIRSLSAKYGSDPKISSRELAQDLGVCKTTPKKWIAELKKAGLIQSYMKREGCRNNYCIIEHEWMRGVDSED
jgi:hypothetical protein